MPVERRQQRFPVLQAQKRYLEVGIRGQSFSDRRADASDVIVPGFGVVFPITSGGDVVEVARITFVLEDTVNSRVYPTQPCAFHLVDLKLQRDIGRGTPRSTLQSYPSAFDKSIRVVGRKREIRYVPLRL